MPKTLASNMEKVKEVASPKKPPAPAIVGLVCIVLALALQVVGAVTKEWVSTASLNYGMWQYCVSGSCSSLPNSALTNGLRVTRAFCVMAVLAAAMATAVSLVLICMKERVVSLTAGVLALSAALCMLVEFSVFAVDVTTTSFGYSFYMCVGAFVLALVAGICLILVYCMGRGKR